MPPHVLLFAKSVLLDRSAWVLEQWCAAGHSCACHHAGCSGNSTLTEGCAAQILFKKRMFRETDETITEPQFVTLSYVQVHALVALALTLQPRFSLLPWSHRVHMQTKGNMRLT